MFVRPELIGGARVTVGDNVIDATVAEQLRAMAVQLRASRRRDPHFDRKAARRTRAAADVRKTMQLNPSEISELIKSKIQHLDTAAEIRTQGTVVSISDGICRVHGLSSAMQGEMLEFPNNTFGLALNLERDSVGAVILGPYEKIKEGDTVKCTGRILDVPVGPELIGRVVDSLGRPIDGKGPVNAKMRDVIEKVAPGVIERQKVSQPVQTGSSPSTRWCRSAAASASSSSATARPARPRWRSTRSSTRRART